jgi:hypothetical protein
MRWRSSETDLIPDEVLSQIRERLDYAGIFAEFCGPITGSGEWRETCCLFHDDNDPSMGINLRHGGFICHACGASGDFIDFYERVRSINFIGAIEELARRVGIEWEPYGDPEERANQEIDSAIITSTHERLIATPDKLEYLMTERGLTREIIDEYKLGHDGQRFYIPIMEGGAYVNIRRYDPSGLGSHKMISWRTGFGQARLWPMSVLFNAEAGDVVYIFEGEMDCLLARSRGLNAVTCTGGAGTWRDPWSVLFVGLNVVICYDADTAGRAGAAMVARKLYGRAEKVRVVTIPLPEIQGADFTDYIVGHGHAVEDFLQLVRDTPEFEPSSETEDPQPEIHLGTMTAAQILSDPESLRPPQVVVENFGWLQRTTLISAREKSGKSTLLTALATAVSSNRPWLGTPVLEGEVLWVGLEEHPHDQARRLGEMGADLEHVHLVVPPFDLRDPVRWLDRLVCSIDPRLVGIDSLAALAVKFVKDSNSPDDWTGLFTELTCVVRESSAAWIFLAHSKKEGNEYRGSTAIGANVDAILQMKEEAQGVRRFTNNRARWIVRDFAIRLAENEYGLVGGEVSLEASILTFIGTNPGASLTHIRGEVTGSNTRIRNGVHRLVSEGQIVNRGMDTHGTAYYLIAEATDAD